MAHPWQKFRFSTLIFARHFTAKCPINNKKIHLRGKVPIFTFKYFFRAKPHIGKTVSSPFDHPQTHIHSRGRRFKLPSFPSPVPQVILLYPQEENMGKNVKTKGWIKCNPCSNTPKHIPSSLYVFNSTEYFL